MVQGTSENAAHRIAKNGFGTVSTTDSGWYGQGIYFTSKLSYASYFSQALDPKPGIESENQTKEVEKVFLLSLVVPGNAYPVTETHTDQAGGYFGKPCKPGYQSHYVITNHTGVGGPFKGEFDFTSNAVANELVVFRGAQTLPICILYYLSGKFGASPPSHSQDERPFVRGEFLLD